jgi:hypothetical protein
MRDTSRRQSRQPIPVLVWGAEPAPGGTHKLLVLTRRVYTSYTRTNHDEFANRNIAVIFSVDDRQTILDYHAAHSGCPTDHPTRRHVQLHLARGACPGDYPLRAISASDLMMADAALKTASER